jgi:two-component system sensor histidine kinase HydH
MRRLLVALLTISFALVLTGGLSWFAVRNYRAAAPLAEENLRGLALTLAGAMESLAARDTSLTSLNSLVSPEVAYSALITGQGKILFHTNADLTGSVVGDARHLPVVREGTMREGRVRLGTGETVYEFQAPFHFAGEVSVLRLALHTWRAEAVMRRARQGQMVIFSLLAVGWLMGGGIVLLLHRQAVQQRLADRQHELARLGEVGAVLAHEVRNPLAGIKGYGQLLVERFPAGREHDFAGLIVSEAVRLEGLVDDILLYTRGAPENLATVNLAAVALPILTLLAPQAEELGARISCDLPDDLAVCGQEEGLRRVLLNLLTNALQASPENGVVTLAARRAGKWVELTVADQGGGIPAEMRAELFLPFRTSKARGSGLGLAICKKIIDGGGGSIRAEAAPGGGALLRVVLPAA